MKYLLPTAEGESGAAADTGSAMHAAIHAFHSGADISASLAVMASRANEYKLADMADASAMFINYASDSRNRGAKVVLAEKPIEFTIAAAPTDPTGEPIHIIGTLDQVRENDGRYSLWDAKSSKKEGTELLNQHTFQIAAYCVGATMLLGKPVHPGGLILTRKYNGKDPSAANVFWPYCWKFEDIEQILMPIRFRVAEIRAGYLYHVPNENCKWCHARMPELCLPKLQELKRVTRD